jgi:hypothetical protein
MSPLRAYFHDVRDGVDGSVRRASQRGIGIHGEIIVETIDNIV